MDTAGNSKGTYQPKKKNEDSRKDKVCHFYLWERSYSVSCCASYFAYINFEE